MWIGGIKGAANTADCAECELSSDGVSYARLVKRTAEECHVPFRHRYQATSPPSCRNEMPSPCSPFVVVAIQARPVVEHHHLDLLKICHFGLAYRVILRTLPSMSASSQRRFCIRSRQGYQRLHSCNPLLPCLLRQSASSDYAS